MKKIVIDHSGSFVHLNLGITDARVSELEEQIDKEILSDAIKNGIVSLNEEEAEVNLSGSKIIDHLINKIAQTEEERLFLMMHVQPLTEVLDTHIKRMSHGLISSDEASTDEE